MPAQPLTFPCPFCGRRMGVAAEWAGRRVRCPHCKQVVQAPPAEAPAAPPPPAPPPAPAPAAPEPVFNLPAKEAADSILSAPGESEDDVFGSQEGGRMPVLPPQDITPDDPLPTAPPAHSPPLILPPPERVPPAPAGNPFAFEATPAPALATPPPPRVPPSPPAAAPRPRPAPPPDGDEPIAVEELPEEDDEPPRRPDRRGRPDRREEPERAVRPPRAAGRAAEGRGGVPSAAVYGLAGYAVLATGLAVYGLFFKPADLPPDHPLSTVPDTYGEFDPAARKGDKGKTSANRVRGDKELPAELRAGLGEKVAVGGVEVEPLEVRRRHLHLFAEGKGDGPPVKAGSPGHALVLRLKVRNASDDLTFCPLDPAFNRKTVTTDDRPLTRLVVGGETFAGGPVAWPFRASRQFEQEQKDDAIPLGPGEAREYVVCSPADPKVIAAVRAAKGPVLWRVQVRRGPVVFRDREVPVTAVVGVEFRKEDVAGL
ncbi:MAG: hypothetical protein C0501_02895 [Isosphaera sp.]|nr:hypothetical protein [Isosphaera sp.]